MQNSPAKKEMKKKFVNTKSIIKKKRKKWTKSLNLISALITSK